MDAIYQMELHQTLTHKDGYSVLRVPGGWIYQHFNYMPTQGPGGDWIESYQQVNTFVPFNNEFMGKS